MTFCRPILQGDIFEGVHLPGFDGDQYTVQIVTHPCSMRRGQVMNERIQVAPVMAGQHIDDWNGHLMWQPLPDLHEDGKHWTRAEIPLSTFREESATVLAEAELQEIWVEQVLGDAEPDVAAVDAAAAGFQDWLDEDDKSRRRELDNEANHAGLRKAVRAAAKAAEQKWVK